MESSVTLFSMTNELVKEMLALATWDLTEMKHHILLCNGGSCNRAGAEQLTQAVREEITKRGLDPVIHTTRTRCNGRCKDQCVAIVYPQGTWYKNLQSEDAEKLISSIINGKNELAEKVSYQWKVDHFERTEGTIVGEKKVED